MRELKAQITGALFVVMTVAAVLCAVINFQQQSKFKLPDDGAIWSERQDEGNPSHVHIEAVYVVPNSQAAKAGLRKGDTLLRINQVPVVTAGDVPQILVAIGAWNKAEYAIRRNGIEAKANVVIAERQIDSSLYYQYLVGAAYLAIGLFVWFRRASAPMASHFFLLCFLSFVLSSFHYTGKLNTFDKIIYLGNTAAGLLAPAAFLHFCLSFPQPPRWLRRGWQKFLLYIPAIVVLLVFTGVSFGFFRTSLPLTDVRWVLDRLWLSLLSTTYLAGAAVLSLRYRKTEDLVLRQQMKWLRNGAILGVLPFTALYVVPYALGAVPGPMMKMAVLSLGFIPLTWAYAIIRYRLMDVDVIFQQGYVYTVATLAVLGVIYGLIFVWGDVDELSPSAVVILIVIATFVFQPIRNYLQEVLDRHVFYRDTYNYRLTLVEFARELGSETDVDRMQRSVGDRLLPTLSVSHVGFVVAGEEDGKFRLEMTRGERPNPAPAHPDFGFLKLEENRPYLFFESLKRGDGSIGDLGYTYYLPCSVRGNIIAWIGVSRTTKGDFLSSDDLELLESLAGYVGIAIENSRLYRSLERKASEYERLKEFSENIVESINVGILAADLNDRVESWNTRMEDITGVARETAIGQPLKSLLPRGIVSRLDSVRGETGTHHLDKVRLESWVGVNGNGHGVREATINIAIAPLVSKENEQIGRLIIFDDITDRSELERRLVQADKLSSIGLLAAGVAHEVNTPLAVISTYAQLLAKQVNGDQQKSVMLEKIAKQTFRASEIVNSLLNFSRTSPTELTRVDLARVLREVLSLIEHQLHKSGVVVDLDIPAELPAVRGNPGKLQQVFLNLFLNARDAMDTGGTLNVRAWTDNGTAWIDIADTGKGIAAENLQRIFDPFFTTKGSKKGTGLGLSITYGIVQEHGGTIEVDSRTERGTRFRLSFPLVRKPAPELADSVVNA